MRTKIQDKINDFLDNNQGARFKNQSSSKDNWPIEILIEKISEVFKEMYTKSKVKKATHKSNQVSIENQTFLSRSNLSSKSDIKILTDEKIERVQYNFELTDKLENKIKATYSDLLQEFTMTADNLLEYFDMIVQQRIKNKEFEIEDDQKFEKFKIKNISNQDDILEQACLKLVYNKINKLIPKKRLVKDKDEIKTKEQIKKLLDDYLKREKEDKDKIKYYNPNLLIEENKENFGSSTDVLKINEENNIDDPKDTTAKSKNTLFNLVPKKQIGSILRFTEFLCILIFFVCNHLFINQVPLSDLNYMNSVMLDTFNNTKDCIDVFYAINSPLHMNDWMYNCLVVTLENDFNTVNNIRISFVEIQIENYELEACIDSNDFNITWSAESQPMCISTVRQYINETKQYLFKHSSVIVNKPLSTSVAWSLLDYLFLRNSQLIDAETISIASNENNKAVENFKNMLETGRLMRCKVFDIVPCDVQYANNDFKSLLLNFYGELIITPTLNTAELVDLGTQSIKIYVYFSTPDIIGVTLFMYNVTQISVQTDIFTRSFANSDPNLPNAAKSYYLEYIQIICAVILSLQFYLKYRKIRSIKDTLNNSFFFLLFLIFFVFEYIFKLQYNLNGKGDYVFTKQLLYDSAKRELVPYYLENIKILKAFSIACLSYHMIYVVFDIKYLVVFTSFLKPVFQRFMIVLALIILSLSLMVNIISGRFYVEFSSFSLTFFNILNYVLGVDSPSITDDSTFTVGTIQTRFYFQVAFYALRILVVNFSLIIMFYLYRKNDNKMIREQKIVNNEIAKA